MESGGVWVSSNEFPELKNLFNKLRPVNVLDKLPPAINIYGTIFQAIYRWKYNNRDFITFSSLVISEPTPVEPVAAIRTPLEDGRLRTTLIPAHLIKPTKRTLRRNTLKTMVKSNEKFAAYRSRSELGVWRLLFFNSNGSFHKGRYDYVQQTMIHFDLQKYFNEHYDSLRLVDSEIEKRKFMNFGIKFHGIDNLSRIESIPIFNRYSENENHHCGKPYPNRNQDLKHFSDELQTVLPTPGKPILVYKNYNFTDIEPGNSTTRMNADIYRIVMGRIGDKSIILYFMLYNLSVNGENYRPIDIQNKLGPLFLTTSLRATRYGVFEKYIVSGNYICKMLDYTQQCLATNLKCTIDYSFIGQIYENIWPYTHPTLQKLIEDKVSSNKGNTMLANAAERVASNVTAENVSKDISAAVAESVLNGGTRKSRRNKKTKKNNRRYIS